MLISHITVGRGWGSKQANVGQGLSFSNSKVIMVWFFMHAINKNVEHNKLFCHMNC